MSVCPFCDRNGREGARFCDWCGQSLAEVAARPGDRLVELRYDTFLFCDLVDSTRLANQLDLEDLRGVFREFRQIVRDVVRGHGGYVNQFMGDGAFVSFGYPEPREDAEETAIRAGLKMIASLRSAKPIAGIELDLRVGIASGNVVVGAVANEPSIGESLVIGSVPHLAARLMAEAPAGGVVVAAATRRQAGRFFEYRDLGRRTLKGFDAPVQAWLVLGETSIASRFEAHRLDPAADLLGRDDVVAWLMSAWQRARAGAGQVVVLAGEAGIGKSRIARAICQRACDEGAQQLELDCTSRTSHTPLHPVSSLLHRLLRIRRLDDAKTRERGLATLLEGRLGAERGRMALGYLGPLVGIEPAEGATAESAERIREHVIRTLVDLMKAIATRVPTVLLLEDMHWADPTTLFLMQKMCGEISSLPVLIVATVRSPPTASEVELTGASVLSIEPLDSVASEGVIRRTPGGETLPDHVIETIVRRAEGNPLFLEELTGAVVDQPFSDAGREGRSAAPAVVPTSLQMVIATRLDRRPHLKPIVQAASVLGREFPMPLLAELLAERRSELPEAVARLVDLGLLTAPDGTKMEHVRFKHALIHESVYQTILRSEKQRLHSRAAEVLVQHFDGTPESAPDVLAHHLAAAHRFEEAIRSLITAGGNAGRRAAYLESVGHCRAGLALIDEVNDPRPRSELKLELLTQLGVALSATSGYAAPEVEETYEQARALCEAGTEAGVLFPIVRGLGTFYFVRCRLGTAAEVSASCLRLAQESQRIDFRIEALSFRGYTCVFRGQFAEGRASLEECLDLYRIHGGHRLRYPSPQDAGIAAWSLVPIAAWVLGDAAGAQAAVDEALSHCARLGRPFDTAYVHVWIAMLRNMQRRFDEAERHSTICIEISQRHGFNTWLVAATMHACMARASRAASPESIAMLRQTLDMFIQAGAEANASFFLWGVAQGLRLTGETKLAAETVAEALNRADVTGESYFRSELLILAAHLEADTDAACAHLRRALDLAEQQGAVVLALRAALELLRRQGRSSGDPERDRRARCALDGATPYPDESNWALAALVGARLVLGPSPALKAT